MMAQVTQVAFLIDLNSFPIVCQPRTNLESSSTAIGCSTFDAPPNGSSSQIPTFSTPTAGVAGVSTAIREQSSPSRIGPTVSKENPGGRYCLYPTLQAHTKTPPRMLALDSASDCSDYDYDDWPGSEERQVREHQIAENLQAVKEIILERLEMASLVNGDDLDVETENVQWSYQFFDSSREVIKTKSNAKKFFKLDLEEVRNFEQILGQELATFVHSKRKFEKKKKKMLTNGNNYYDQDESNRLTCLSSALKNIMSDIPWVDASGPANTKYNNILYILHHLPSNQREVSKFANGHIPVGKCLGPRLLRDALLPPAFLNVLRDKLQIKLNFVDISYVGGKGVTSEIGTDNEVDETGVDEENRKSFLVIQKMLQMLHAKHETCPERQIVPLHYGSWYLLLKKAIEAASLRAKATSGQNNMMIVPFVDKMAQRDREREKKRVSADSGAEWKDRDMLRRSDRKRDSRDLHQQDRECRSVRTLAVATPNDPLLRAAEMSPRVKVGTWLGHSNDSNVYIPPSQSQSQDGEDSEDGDGEDAISVDSFNLEEFTKNCKFGESSRRKVKYTPFDRRRQAQAIENGTKLAVTQNQSQISNSSGQYGNYESHRNRPSTSMASRGIELIKRKSGGNERSANGKPQQPPPNTSYLSLRNPRHPIEIVKTSKNGRGRPKGSKNTTKALVPFTGRPSLSLPQFGKGYETRSKSHGDKPPQLFALPAKGWGPPAPVSAIAYVAPQPTQTMPGHKKDNTSPPNRVNVKRNLDNVFNFFGEQRDDQQRQQSTSANKHASANKRSAGQNRGKNAPTAPQSRVLKSKRKLQMDDEGVDNNQKAAGPSHGHGATIQDKGHGNQGASSALTMYRTSPTTPQRKRLKRLTNLSAEKTVIQESPQIDRRPIRTRGKGGQPKVDPVSFYSHGSNESKVWEISGQKLAAQRMQDSVEDSKGVLQNLSSHNLELDYENEFEILASSSPECGPDSIKKRKLEAENSTKYYHFRSPPLPQSPLALYSTPPAKAVASEEKSPASPCMLHFVVSERNKSVLPAEDTQEQTVVHESASESKEVKEAVDTKSLEIEQQEPRQRANTVQESESLPVEVEVGSESVLLAPDVNTESVPTTDVKPVTPKFTPPPRKAKQSSAATSSAMMASFSSTSSSDCTTPKLDIDALITGKILNTPDTPVPRKKRGAKVTVDTSSKAPTPNPTRQSNKTPKPIRDPGPPSSMLSPDIADFDASRAKISDAVELVKRTPRQTAAAKRKEAGTARTPKTPAPVAPALSILSPSPARTPVQLNQRTPQRGGSSASSSNASQRQILFSDTTPDKMHPIDFSKFAPKHLPIYQVTPPPVNENESNANIMEEGENEANEDVNTEISSLTTGATATTDETTSTMSATKKKRKRRAKASLWSTRRGKAKKRNPKTDSNTDEQSDESSSFGLTPTPSPRNPSGHDVDSYAENFSY